MARRGSNSFKRNDGLRALKIAKDGGLEPNTLDVIVAPDGAVTYRVYGKEAAGPTAAKSDLDIELADWEAKRSGRKDST